MVSRIKRIVTRADDPPPDASQLDRERIDPHTLLAQVRSGLSVTEAIQDDLNRREQELLSDASILFEQLKAIAHELANLQEQQGLTDEHADKLQAAVSLLEMRCSDTYKRDHGSETPT